MVGMHIPMNLFQKGEIGKMDAISVVTKITEYTVKCNLTFHCYLATNL